MNLSNEFLLILCQLIGLYRETEGLVSSRAAVSSSNTQTTEISPSWCGLTDNGFTCIARQDQPLIIPCGDFYQQHGVTYTYLIRETSQILAAATTDHLSIKPRWNHTGLHVCCYPNTTVSLLGFPCYKLQVLYPPMEVPTKWPMGTSKWPLFGNPFELECPLAANPPANYSWRKYTSLNRNNETGLSDEVVFSKNGKAWHISSYSENENGVYECQASNQLGTRVYSDDILFFLRPDPCSQSLSANTNASLWIAKTGMFFYATGESISLTCRVNSALTYGERPFWFFVRNGTMEFCLPPLYDPQQPKRGDKTCSWSNTLIVRGFSAELAGEYVCRYGKQSVTERLEMKDMSTSIDDQRGSSLVSTVLVPALLVVILPLVLQWMSHYYRQPSFSRSKEPERRGFTYDVFISAHDETRDLVYRNILIPLEQDSNPPYKVCWHLRDFVAGVSIAEQIADAVRLSRKVIFVFSRQFSESKFCQLELDQAIHRLMVSGTRCLVPIALDEEAVPMKLKNMLTYWPLVIATQDRWIERIKQLIGDPI